MVGRSGQKRESVMTVRHRFDPSSCVRQFESDDFARRRDADWFARQVAVLPWQWQDEIKRRWLSKWSPDEVMRRPANLAVLKEVAQLSDAQRAGLRPDAGDNDVRARADVMVRHFRDGIDRRRGDEAEQWARDSMARSGLTEFWPCGETVAAQLERLKCMQFWRRVLRGLLAKTSETCAIGMGLVHKHLQCYLSDLSLKRDVQRKASARKVIERTFLENEFGQQVAVADLADKGTGNKSLRLAEMMTRISGMDLIAQDMAHEGLFITVTCPSRMHARSSLTGRENPRYDGTTPKQAQQYLCLQWGRLGPWLSRRGVELYGFRVVEPHHDGCPHWHMLLFYKVTAKDGRCARAVMQEGFNRYFLSNDSAHEPGASLHRVKFKRIDRTKGSAAAYVAKYISKNTTGFGMDFDFFGNPIVTAVQRVQAWASTWRVHQFQQIGGAPVGVWRELRRVNPEALEGVPLPQELTRALSGANVGQMGGRVAVGYQAYTMAQGGPCVSRKHRALKLLKQESGELNRYGEARGADVIGVQAAGWNLYRREDMVAMLGKLAPELKRPAFVKVETERCQWRHVTRAQLKPEGERSIKGIQAGGEAVRPWTRVNNSTRLQVWDKDSIRDVVVVTRSKTGNFRGWKAPDGPPVDQAVQGVA